MIAVQLLNNGEDADHSAKQRQQDAGKKKNFLADRHWTAPRDIERRVRIELALSQSQDLSSSTGLQQTPTPNAYDGQAGPVLAHRVVSLLRGNTSAIGA
ncbi:hypothetical protein [Bradyrhizobium ottawaense]|uniref:hypothetical protein n=1 Tax=Bradyrhizobium ottawaense TaxID=931866 RepID=UPI00155FC1BD|nr:hypothetical protein [Bradyrhizobium ottawaense]